METARPARPDVPAPGDGGSEAVQLPGRFEHFYLEEFPAVVALAYALSGSRTGAEDIAQEAFLRAYRDWDRVGSYAHRVAWVRRVAANLATSGLRRRVVEARALIRLAGRWEPAVDPLPAENAEFWAAVRALPARQAQALALYYLADRSIQQTAAVPGCAEGSLKAHLAKARRALARRLRRGWRGGAMSFDDRASACTRAALGSVSRGNPVAGLEDLRRRRCCRLVTRTVTATGAATALALVAWAVVRGPFPPRPLANRRRVVGPGDGDDTRLVPAHPTSLVRRGGGLGGQRRPGRGVAHRPGHQQGHRQHPGRPQSGQAGRRVRVGLGGRQTFPDRVPSRCADRAAPGNDPGHRACLAKPADRRRRTWSGSRAASGCGALIQRPTR